VRAALGPESARRPAPAFFERALAAARHCGVTRLADVTGLDRLGLPVWQAVRPAGRSLSVHQGKGPTPEAARIGALCEAIEAHCAENVIADGPVRAFADLLPSERAPELGDYCKVRTKVPDRAGPIRWCSATDLMTGGRHYLPHDLISIDFTRGLPSAFERASSGLGAGPSEADALQTSLLEVIERDAVGEWRRMDLPERLATSVELDTVPFGWFQWWRARLGSLDIELRVFLAASIVGVPVPICVIGGIEEFGSAYRRFYGTCAHGDAEIALFRALAEALQSRLTFIAGVRDDILPSHYARSRPKPAAEDDAAAGRAWSQDEPCVCGPDALAELLAGRGYRQIVVKHLGDGLDGVVVTKAFIPGLGSLSRTRREAL